MKLFQIPKNQKDVVITEELAAELERRLEELNKEIKEIIDEFNKEEMDLEVVDEGGEKDMVNTDTEEAEIYSRESYNKDYDNGFIGLACAIITNAVEDLRSAYRSYLELDTLAYDNDEEKNKYEKKIVGKKNYEESLFTNFHKSRIPKLMELLNINNDYLLKKLKEEAVNNYFDTYKRYPKKLL